MIRSALYSGAGVALAAAVFIAVSTYAGYLADRALIHLSAHLDTVLPF